MSEASTAGKSDRPALTRAEAEEAVARAGRKLEAARERQDAAFAEVKQAVLAAIGLGAVEYKMAQAGHVDRMTVRDWQGKPRKRHNSE